MPTLIIAVTILFFGAIFLSTRIRNTVMDYVAGATNYVVGAWPTWGSIWTALRPVWITLLVLLGLTILSWIVFFGLMLSLGIYSNSPWYGALIGIAFPIWCILYIIKMGKLTKIPLWITTIFLIVAIPHFLLGVWSPEIKSSFDGWMGFQKQEVANSLDKDSAQSEPVSGIFAVVIDDTTIVNNKGEPVREVKRGEVVRVISLETIKATVEAEGMLSIRCQDKYGHYGGSTGLIPSRLLDWKWNKESAPIDLKQANYNPAPAPAYTPPAPTYNLPVEAPASREEPTPVNIAGNFKLQWCNEPPTRFEITQAGNNFRGEKRYRVGGIMTIDGSITGNHITGVWKLIGHPAKEYGEGTFSLDINATTSGEGIFNYGGKECPLTIYKI